MTNNYKLIYEEFLNLANEISPHQGSLTVLIDLGIQMPKWNFTWNYEVSY